MGSAGDQVGVMESPMLIVAESPRQQQANSLPSVAVPSATRTDAQMVTAMTAAKRRDSVAAPRQTSFGPMALEPIAPSEASDGKSPAMACLNAAIDHSGVQRKALAADIDGMTEQHFSKLTSGVQAFPVALLDALPDHLVVEFCDRLCRERGARVMREDEELLAAFRAEAAINDWIRVRVRAAR